jgi:GT2 family glycosyltransferase
MICMPRPSDKRVIDETAEYIRQETKISWVGLAKGGVYAEAPEYARNAMVAEAKEGDITHILTLDADTVPPPDTILKLLKHDRDIIAGVYPLFVQGRKCWSFSLGMPHINYPDGGAYSVKITEIDKNSAVVQSLYPYQKLTKKPFKVTALSGSTVLIKIEVFEKFAPWYKTLREGGSVLMGHDFFFSNSAREAGFELWVDPTIQCKHYNTVELNSVFLGD